MKRIYLMAICLLSISLVNAQVGVNTNSPLGVLHIDTKGNTTGTSVITATNVSDDIIIQSNTGNVGIGAINPQYKLHINSGGTPGAPAAGFCLQDGYQGNGKVLMSDIDGVGKWGNLPVNTSTVVGVINDKTTKYYPSLTNTVDMKRTLSLSAGKWLVFVGVHILAQSGGVPINGGIFIRTTLATDASGRLSNISFLQSHIVSRYFAYGAYFQDNTITGVFPIDLAAASTVYLMFSPPSVFGSANVTYLYTQGVSSENYLFAIPIM